MEGRVIRFDSQNGYGFIATEEYHEDVFIHINDVAVREEDFRVGLLVSFDLAEGDKGPKALNVKLLHGELEATRTQYLSELTEVLLESAPSITAGELIQVRDAALDLAVRWGWLD